MSSSGSSRIKDVVIKGTRSSSEPGHTPTLAVSKAPASGAADVSLNADISVKFNKAISLDSGYQVVITENNVPLNNISASLLGQDTVKVSHPNFTAGKTYKVTIPKELVKGTTDGRTRDNDITWSFNTKSPDTGNKTPTLLNMTFNGDPKTSVAFDWYTAETVRGTVVQVVEASNAGGSEFPDQETEVPRSIKSSLVTRFLRAVSSLEPSICTGPVTVMQTAGARRVLLPRRRRIIRISISSM